MPSTYPRHNTHSLSHHLIIAVTCVSVLASTTMAQNDHTANSKTKATTTIDNIDFVTVPAGRFIMGSPKGEASPNLQFCEEQHEATIPQPFLISVTEITNTQFSTFVTDSGYKGGDDQANFLQHTEINNPEKKESNGNMPVRYVSRQDAEAFCKWMSHSTGRTVRLPTITEWEYACRAGSTSRFCFGNDDDELSDYAWIKTNSDDHTHHVKQKKPNNWGLYDIHGNVWEWCDGLVPTQWLKGTPFEGQVVAPIRGGGGYQNNAKSCRCAAGWASYPINARRPIVGFRIVCETDIESSSKTATAP